MTLNKHNSILSVAIIILLSANWACKKNTTTYTPPNPQANIKLVSNTRFGSILTDSAGRTLYFFSIDADGNSGCTGGCLVTWPVFYKPNPRLAAGLNQNDFATIHRSDGQSQTTYKGWPLYYFQNDANAGDVNGDGVDNTWFVAKPDYSVMLANTQLVGLDGVQYNSLFSPGQQVTQYLTDAYGRTLYSFSPDKFRKNTYTAPDFSNNALWPIDTSSVVRNIPSILDKTQFDTLTVFGKMQLVCKGWPLYFFGPDNGKRGSTKGVSVPTPGFWPILNKSSAIAPN